MRKALKLSELRAVLGIDAVTYEAVKPSIKLADNLSANIMESVLKKGIASRADARPFVVFYIAEARKAPTYKGQRGVTFGRGSNYARQVDRILAKMFNDIEAKPVKPKAKKNHKQDAVASLFKKWEALSGAEKRRFARMQIER